MFNAGTSETDFSLLPLRHGFRWQLAMDTFCLAPQDLFGAGQEILVDNSKTYRLGARTSAILLAWKKESVSGGGSL